jgi:hypothetical protein
MYDVFVRSSDIDFFGFSLVKTDLVGSLQRYFHGGGMAVPVCGELVHFEDHALVLTSKNSMVSCFRNKWFFTGQLLDLHHKDSADSSVRKVFLLERFGMINLKSENQELVESVARLLGQARSQQEKILGALVSLFEPYLSVVGMAYWEDKARMAQELGHHAALTPKAGVFFYQAGPFAFVHEPQFENLNLMQDADHQTLWKDWVRDGLEPKNSEYWVVPRARVALPMTDGVTYAEVFHGEPCGFPDEGKAAVIRAFHLDSVKTDFVYNEHYDVAKITANPEKFVPHYESGVPVSVWFYNDEEEDDDNEGGGGVPDEEYEFDGKKFVPKKK